MCIALLTTSRPQYSFILASNRDEFVARPTAQADWWKAPHGHVLGGRDLQRDIQGTWLGITKQGRIGCLTNFREREGQPVSGLKSRGGIVNSFLTIPSNSHEATIDSARRIVEEDGVNDVGGFSLLFGKLRRPDSNGRREGLAIISNRTPDVNGVTWIAREPNEIHGLSNSYFGDATWPKVTNGERLLAEAVQEHSNRANSTEDELRDRLFDILSVDTLPKRKSGESWDAYILQLRNSIFIPRIGGEVESLTSDQVRAAQSTEKIAGDPPPQDTNTYATQVQTVILVDHDGNVTFTEKTLYRHTTASSESQADIKTFRFQIEGW
ncbi:NRDE protein-domain-containing protein [Elsinoe ampelina]|uniref:NRDE protein-domain-containing protein n=1 Tax=Elsinoe ampelina TaxID=302913 RepID=A0A6A6GJ96_9PEZI|nr:NRDE protein-domain-containing protein [Elsinoe ampelina]